MPDRKSENLEKLDIMILSEAEFDAIFITSYYRKLIFT